jgi:hypothetical protein
VYNARLSFWSKCPATGSRHAAQSMRRPQLITYRLAPHVAVPRPDPSTALDALHSMAAQHKANVESEAARAAREQAAWLRAHGVCPCPCVIL